MSGLDLTWVIKQIDSMLRRSQGIEEYSDDPGCLFRISISPANRHITLSDGVSIGPADPVVEIHYWNEHMPVVVGNARNTAWAIRYKRGLALSFQLLAHRVEREPRFAEIAGVMAAPAFSARFGPEITTRICERLGFDVVSVERSDGPIHAWFDSLLIWILMWVFNPATLRGRGMFHGRMQIWMSRHTLISRYGTGADNSMAVTS